ncbi:hypothetical protein RJ639_034951 [Escallonia herrerae]|uniref:Uncharacterized protein n=1 Tax=Escallonia herrerae TaxID=1293975 RepID=A0AA88WXD5_9ASTE|nr:hypothetical protein RJ639_034951 [Escallonia herrerae]
MLYYKSSFEVPRIDACSVYSELCNVYSHVQRFPGLNGPKSHRVHATHSAQRLISEMEKFKMLTNVAIVVLLLDVCRVSMATVGQKKTYIVHMAKSQMPASYDDHTNWYDSSLKSVSDSAEMLYTYNLVAHGFSTRLSAEEARSLESRPGILSVLPELRYELHTTRTPEFLGLDKNADLFPEYSVTDLNYPSFAVAFQTEQVGGSGSGGTSVVKYTRTLTNVGSAATYKASVLSESESVKISVEPESLSFSQVNEKKSYTVTFSAGSMPSSTNVFGRIEWSAGKQTVGSPIAISWT